MLNCIWFFKKRETLFTRFKKDIVEYFVLEHPPGLFYFNYCIYPLFMPPMEFLSLNIGNRIDHSQNNPEMIISNDATPEDMDIWCARASDFICKDVELFVQKVDPVKKMILFLEREECFPLPLRSIVWINYQSRFEILMFAYLYVHDYIKAREAASKYLGEIDTPKHGMIVREKGRACYNHVIELAELADDQIVDQEMEKWREKNIKFFGTR